MSNDEIIALHRLMKPGHFPEFRVGLRYPSWTLKERLYCDQCDQEDQENLGGCFN